ncbi:hypothetical protein CAPTEDRAFT_218127 [Capitella teleta]|uniref:Endonuclease/exonuclease/phosphatase domain-containing protein n=1 Tax=Capitella teleta TaxID=283909 RepID=R7UE58_CAPTE|nr:hypothetical protein CAPTEDRAFT_218127 [Capitella teleta]|eukprot:ELU02068.1 hypothetical protein CAPTEDRAFT_218127 [Capitella teleta]
MVSMIAMPSETPTGYALKHLPRPNRRGGGLALIQSSAIHTTPLCNISRPSFEGFETNISHKKCSICLVAIYRPPSSSPAKYFNEFSDVMSSIIATCNDIIIVGDFNIHLDTPHIPSAKGLISIMDDMNLYQHVHEPMHINGHTLDFVMTFSLTPVHVQVNEVDRSVSSDRFAVLFKLYFDRPPNVKRKFCVRKWKAIDIAALNDEINRLPLSTGDPSSVYTQCMNSITQRLAPPTEIVIEKTKCHRLERKWRRGSLTVDREIYQSQCRQLRLSRDKAKSDFIHGKLRNTSSPNDTHTILNHLLHKQKRVDLPQHDFSTGSLSLSLVV